MHQTSTPAAANEREAPVSSSCPAQTLGRRGKSSWTPNQMILPKKMLPRPNIGLREKMPESILSFAVIQPEPIVHQRDGISAERESLQFLARLPTLGYDKIHAESPLL